MAKLKTIGRTRKWSSPAAPTKDNRFVSEESTPERRKLNKLKLDEYLAAVLAKRADRPTFGKAFQTWKNREVEL